MGTLGIPTHKEATERWGEGILQVPARFMEIIHMKGGVWVKAGKNSKASLIPATAIRGAELVWLTYKGQGKYGRGTRILRHDDLPSDLDVLNERRRAREELKQQ